MRVLFYTYSLCVGGAEVIAAEYLLMLKERGLEVGLVEDFRSDTFLSRKLADSGIPVYTLWNGNVDAPFGWKRKAIARKAGLWRGFNRILRRFHPDVLHFHGMPDHMERLDFPANRMLYTFHSEIRRNLESLGPKNTAVLREMNRQGLLLCALTQAAAEDVRGIFDTRRVFCVPNGMNYDEIRTQRYTRAQLSQLLGIPETGFLLGTVGRLHPVKNHERALRIFREVKKISPDARLVLVGGDWDGRMAKLQAQAREYGIEGDVFFTGVRQDAAAITAAMDCFFLTSLSESFGLVALEAQAQGVRCVCSQVVPQECLCRQDAVGLSLEEADLSWAEAILHGNRKNPNPGDFDIFEIHHVIDSLVETYQRIIHA